MGATVQRQGSVRLGAGRQGQLRCRGRHAQDRGRHGTALVHATESRAQRGSGCFQADPRSGSVLIYFAIIHHLDNIKQAIRLQPVRTFYFESMASPENVVISHPTPYVHLPYSSVDERELFIGKSVADYGGAGVNQFARAYTRYRNRANIGLSGAAFHSNIEHRPYIISASPAVILVNDYY